MSTGALLLVTALASAGCNSILGNDDHSLAPAGGDGSSGSDVGPLSDGPSTGDGGLPSDSPSGATTDAADAADGADGADGGGCLEGAKRCNGNTPQKCVGGAWQDQTPCGGTTPVCSNGVCGTYRTTGGILSTVPGPVAADAGIHLASGGFELGTRSCNEAGVCVTGGLVP